MPAPHALRLALRSALQRKSISVTEVSLSAGLDRTTLSRFLNGRADLKTSSLEKILELFDISLGRLVVNNLNLHDGLEDSKSPVLLRAFNALTPLQKKTFLKSMTQALKHTPPSGWARQKQRLSLADD